MKFKLVKDKKLRESFYKKEKQRILNKFMYTNFLNADYTNDANIKKEVGLYLSAKLDQSVSKTQTVRRCVLTGRSRVNYSKKLKISRIKMREIIKSGVLPGFSRALW